MTKDILLVTGLSGAGKSTVLKTLEYIGWEVVDNMPLLLLDRLLELQVPDQITLDTDELVSLLDSGVAALRDRSVDVLWPRSLGRDLTTTTVLDRPAHPHTRELLAATPRLVTQAVHG